MILKDIYRKDINRVIDGVIQVERDNEETIKQELEEYVVTRELQRHFDTFAENYTYSLDRPTNDIGVWVSGFFGSGKSHFLKILSLVLENRIVAGKPAVEYLEDKFADQMIYSELVRCASVPTETILFNIDVEGFVKKDRTAVLKAFAKVFYNHCGYLGDNFNIAKLEQTIDRLGKFDRFKEAFLRISGSSWEFGRNKALLLEDYTVEALMQGVGMSEVSARNWFNGNIENELSIKQLVADIKEYIDSKGPKFRLVFLVDEIGQYIGSDGELMLNLQSIAEELGNTCSGRVWLIVDSQEAIDKVTTLEGDDFSKIQARFPTRLSLTSSSADEVIKKRILQKTPYAFDYLKRKFERNSAVLANLFTLTNSTRDLKGYAGPEDMAETYPFVPYQFRLVQNILYQIRIHGNSGRHMSGGERSMLSGFKEAAQIIQNKDDNALVPLWSFYDTLNTFLEGRITRVINRCADAAWNHDVIEPYDVSVLKLLYLMRYVGDNIPPNVDNLTVLMIDDIRADKVAMRKQVQESLDRLVSQNYVSRSGENYFFLTDEEQRIERDIRDTLVDSGRVVGKISNIIFLQIYPRKKYRYGANDIPFDKIVDDTPVGQLTDSIRLHFLTLASQEYDDSDESLKLKSDVNHEITVRLSDRYPYFERMEMSEKIKKYANSKNLLNLPETSRAIIQRKQEMGREYEREGEQYLKSAISEGTFFVCGDIVENSKTDPADKIDDAFERLITSVYTKMRYITRSYDSDGDIDAILHRPVQKTLLAGEGYDNPDAVDEVLDYLTLKQGKNIPVSMSDIQKAFSRVPYGWREIDIAGVVATLMWLRRITIKVNGSEIEAGDRNITDYLRNKNYIEKTQISLKKAIPPEKLSRAREFLKEYFDRSEALNVPIDGDDVVDYIIKKFTDIRDRLENIQREYYYTNKYPGREVVNRGIGYFDEVLNARRDDIALVDKMLELETELLDFRDDMLDVDGFFKTQKNVFDDAYALVRKTENEKVSISESNPELSGTLDKIEEILKNDHPYRLIPDLPDLSDKARKAYDQLLITKKKEVSDKVVSAMKDIHTQADNVRQKELIRRADTALENLREFANNSDNISRINNTVLTVESTRVKYMNLIAEPIHDNPPGTPTGTQGGKPPVKDYEILNRTELFPMEVLHNEEEVDKYLGRIKADLLKRLEDKKSVHII